MGDTLENVPGEITQLLIKLRGGNRTAEGRLMELIYRELRRIAANRLKNEGASHSWQPTELVNEAYLRLTRIEDIDWKNRSHFFAVAATLMRRILVDHARTNLAKKRGEGMTTISLTEAVYPAAHREPEILALDEALERLAKLDERQSKIVELRFFAGLSEEETGNVLSISTRTVKRDWRAAKAWLFSELNCG